MDYIQNYSQKFVILGNTLHRSGNSPHGRTNIGLPVSESFQKNKISAHGTFSNWILSNSFG